MRKVVSLLAATAAFTIAAPASAATLFDQTNLSQQFVTPHNLTFTATSASTLLDFQGYNLLGSTALVNIFLGVTGATPSTGANLLAANFTNTSSACPTTYHAGEGSAGPYGTNDIFFGGECVGLYDSLSQTLSTAVGTSYTLKFSLTQSARNSPNGLRITATDASIIPGVPEPATWAMMLVGFGGIGWSMRRKRKAAALQAA